MRCPKCGYISFDHLESCKKCNKQIDEASMQLNGTTYDTKSPSFLKFNLTDLEAVSSDQPVDKLEETIDEEDVIDLSDFQNDEDGSAIELDEISFDIDEEKIEEDDDIILNLDDLDEADPLEKFDTETATQESPSEIPGIDFGDLDISDLAPAEDQDAPVLKQEETDKTQESPYEEKLIFEQDEPAADIFEGIETELETEPEPQAARPTPEQDTSPGLEDLLLDELEFDKSVTTKNIAPSSKAKPVKTGTALDNFDIDLGELFTEKEK